MTDQDPFGISKSKRRDLASDLGTGAAIGGSGVAVGSGTLGALRHASGNKSLNDAKKLSSLSRPAGYRATAMGAQRRAAIQGHELKALAGKSYKRAAVGAGVAGAGLATKHFYGDKKNKVSKSAFGVDHDVSKSVLLPKPFRGLKKLKPLKPAKPGASSKTDNSTPGSV